MSIAATRERREPRTHWLALALGLTFVVSTVGCGDDDTVIMLMDSSVDGVDAPRAGDSDEDGVCDTTEVERGSDPTRVDTDGDGFSDLAELFTLGSNVTDNGDPNRERVFILRESESSAVQIPIERAFTGGGEDYVGVFEPGAEDDAGISAATFFTGAVASFAEPMSNVAIIDGEAFRGLNGRTLLSWEARFEYSDTPRACIRAYPFRYSVKRSDGRIVFVSRLTLLVLPVGQTLATGQWCLPLEGCR